MKKNKITAVKNVLTAWNPIQHSLMNITDLNEYETEVEDVLFGLGIEYDYPNKKVNSKQVNRMLKEVLNEAFNLHLTATDCEDSAIKIAEILNEN